MPLVRIDLPAGKSAEYRRSVADVVYDALRAIRTLYRAEEEILGARIAVAEAPAEFLERKAS